MENSAVAVMYHRFGENEYPSTNIRIQQFKSHVQEMTSDKYNVMSLEKIITNLQAGKPLPDRSVAITIDDAYSSVYEIAWPMLKSAGLPFTIFMSADPVDQGKGGYMSWDQLREMSQSPLVDIAGHSLRHAHLAEINIQTAQHDIQSDFQRIKDEIGKAPALFSYPYGEASTELMNIVKETGYISAFGQHSGAMTSADNQYFLPRFPVNERYGELDRFSMSINTLGLAVTDVLPKDPLLYPEHPQNPPSIGFTLPKGLKNSNQLACYHSKEGKIENTQHIGSRRIELRFTTPFGPSRTRINCTLPADEGRWYWYGMQFYTKK